ncbi:MAG TPA: WYL domain-containing protein [Leptospiraceae bacterium]|nr:WYL domain-containing protein [Leptospirales bacterium]HMU81699.1 WYL domain-containing protein [Leptospiraceae bacterium]HMW59502.1 WYL domain-containing protein [Leptospiraceae bacterium]HMX56529.1 WYL domain-containing protein [Leptospiraceae bacterium]HNE23749.1 WYL domain-containing protein [Leptospiraceae bacterium]
MPGTREEGMAKMERLGCLYLTFLNHPNGLSFSKIRDNLAPAYSGDPESARRKFERDKDELRLLGLDLEHFPDGQALPNGNLARGHIYVPRNEFEKLPDLKMSAEEASALSAVLLYAIENTKDERNAELYRSAATKLLYRDPSLLSRGSSQDFWAPSESFVDHLAPIRSAIRKRLLLEIEYPDKELGSSIRLVEGRGLISHRGRWCLVGFARDANAIRYFYLDRIVSVNVTKTQFRADPRFNIKEHTLHPLTLSIHEAAVIDLLLHEEGKEAMVDFLSGIPDNRVKFGNEKNAARIQLRIKTTNKEALFSFMFRNPGVVVQIGPEDIRKDYLNYIARIRSQYGANP